MSLRTVGNISDGVMTVFKREKCFFQINYMLCCLSTYLLSSLICHWTESNFFRCSSYYARRTRAGYSVWTQFQISELCRNLGLTDLPNSLLHHQSSESGYLYSTLFERNIWMSKFFSFKKVPDEGQTWTHTTFTQTEIATVRYHSTTTLTFLLAFEKTITQYIHTYFFVWQKN